MQRSSHQPDDRAILSELERILWSQAFSGSARHRHFLTYIVSETLAGRGERLKAYSIATEAFGRSSDFDPQQDSIVRIEAGRLRRALEHYYLTEGRANDLRIVIPKGSYVPTFVTDTTGSDQDASTSPDCRLVDGRHRGPRLFVMPLEQADDAVIAQRLAQGLTRQLIAQLTRFSDILVYGFETSHGIGSGVRPETLPDSLKVDFILTGSVSADAGTLTVDFLLQRADNLQFVWSGSQTRALDPTGIRTLLGDVAVVVAQTLAQPYGVLFHQALDHEGAVANSLDGYRAVVDFYEYLRTLNDHDLPRVRRQLESVVATDPGFAGGLACLSQTYCALGRSVTGSTEERARNVQRAVDLARRAVHLAPNSSSAHHALALALWFEGDLNGSFAAYDCALALNPNDTVIMADLGVRHCMRMQWDEGVRLVEGAFLRNPCLPSPYRIAFFLDHFAHGRFEQAYFECLQMHAPNYVYRYVGMAVSAVRVGWMAEAQEALSYLLTISHDYAGKVEQDLAARNVHPVIAREMTQALSELALSGHVARRVARTITDGYLTSPE